MDVRTEVYNYKLYHEQFMQNLNGTTTADVLLVILPAPIGIFLSAYLCAVLTYWTTQKMSTPLKLVSWLPFLVDLMVVVLPLVLCFTIFSDMHIVVSLIFLLSLFICVGYCCTSCRKVFSQHYISMLLTTPIAASKRPYGM